MRCMVLPQPPLQPQQVEKGALLSVARKKQCRPAVVLDVACKQHARSGGMESIKRVAGHQEGPFRSHCQIGKATLVASGVGKGTQC